MRFNIKNIIVVKMILKVSKLTKQINIKRKGFVRKRIKTIQTNKIINPIKFKITNELNDDFYLFYLKVKFEFVDRL